MKKLIPLLLLTAIVGCASENKYELDCEWVLKPAVKKGKFLSISIDNLKIGQNLFYNLSRLEITENMPDRIEASKEYFDLLDEIQKVAPHKQIFILDKTSLDFDSSLSAMVEGKWKLIDYWSGFCKLK